MKFVAVTNIYVQLRLLSIAIRYSTVWTISLSLPTLDFVWLLEDTIRIFSITRLVLIICLFVHRLILCRAGSFSLDTVKLFRLCTIRVRMCVPLYLSLGSLSDSSSAALSASTDSLTLLPLDLSPSFSCCSPDFIYFGSAFKEPISSAPLLDSSP